MSTHDPYAAFRVRDFRFFLTGNLAAAIGMQMQSVAVGWEIYERTGSSLALGYVGLVQVLPVILLAIPAGHVADRVDRKVVMMTAAAVIAMSSLGLAFLSATNGNILAIYLCLLLTGTARAFQQPAKSAFLPSLVPRSIFPNAVTWNTGGFHLACVVGPALGGLVIALTERAMLVYLFDASALMLQLILLSLIAKRTYNFSTEPTTVKTLMAGFDFVRGNKIILAALTLDMFGVLLGGATMLLPIYAKDILMIGPSGLGWMRAAPAIGALTMAFFLAYHRPLEQAGKALLWAVGGFAVATILFGLSRHVSLSLLMLFLLGAFDNISVVVRHTLVQLLTPDAMRGRVSAINSMFIGASNELGGFESGLVAHLVSPTFSVVSGGVGTIVVVIAVAFIWPQIRSYGRLDQESTS